MSNAGRAVFLSYASQDAEAARRICESLRSGGVEVWFDADGGLEHGDEWDTKIRKQIKECVLFIPIISAHTQARLEGYFRIEWDLAAERARGIASGVPFILPVVIDDTREPEALVPDRFRAVQWTKLPGGVVTPEVKARYLKLWSHRIGAAKGTDSDVARAFQPVGSDDTGSKARATVGRRVPAAAWIAAVVVIAAGALYFALQPEKNASAGTRPPTTDMRAAPATDSATEVARLRARIVPDRWQKGDLEAITPAIDRLIQAEPDNVEAWALRSITHSLQVLRLIDPGTQPLEKGRSAAEHALRLSADAPLAKLAMGLHHVAMVSRGTDPRAARSYIDPALAALPADTLTRFAGLLSFNMGFDFAETTRLAEAWLAAEPAATYPAQIMSSISFVQRRAADVEKWSSRALTDSDFTGLIVRLHMVGVHFYLRADAAASRAALDQVPVTARGYGRVVHWRWQVAMADRRWDDALQELAQVPDTFIFDSNFNGPKALLAGAAHQRAGRRDAALAQWREAERLLREKLVDDTQNEALRVNLAVALAEAGRGAEARNELAQVEPLLRTRPPNTFLGRLIAGLAQAHGALGDTAAMAVWLRKLFTEPSHIPLTPASLRLDPRFNTALDAPEIQALMKEFAHLDQPASGATEKSIAVLAFENLSGDKDNEYFSDGISEELLNVLAKVPGLRVAARTSAFYFKGKNATAQEIGQKLGVAHLVDGSVRKAGTKVRIAARLSKADTGEQIWSEPYEDELKDVFALQDRIARDIAEKLQVKLALNQQPKREVHPEAHRLYLEGRHFWSQRTDEAFARAEAALTRAIEIDPRFARAHAGLADLWAIRGWYSTVAGIAGAPAFLDQGEAAARKALELDPSLAEIHATFGAIHLVARRLPEAEREIGLCLAQAPNYATAVNWRAEVMIRKGRLDLAVADFLSASRLDPLSPVMLIDCSGALLWAHQPAAALEFAERARALIPAAIQPNIDRARALLELQRPGEALAAVRALRARLLADKTLKHRFAIVVHLLRRAGAESEAVALAEDAMRAEAPDSFIRGYILAALGRLDEAFPLLAKTPPAGVQIMFWNDFFESVRADPRFQDLMAKLGCAEEYKVARETLARMLKERTEKK
jgi:TolB-like protein